MSFWSCCVVPSQSSPIPSEGTEIPGMVCCFSVFPFLLAFLCPAICQRQYVYVKSCSFVNAECFLFGFYNAQSAKHFSHLAESKNDKPSASNKRHIGTHTSQVGGYEKKRFARDIKKYNLRLTLLCAAKWNRMQKQMKQNRRIQKFWQSWKLKTYTI